MTEHVQTYEELMLEAQEAEATGLDMSTPGTGGGSGPRVFPKGYAFARLVKYIEVGVHPQSFQGKPKDPCLEFFLEFALYNTGQEQPGDTYMNDDGKPGSYRTWNFRAGNNEKSATYKLFKKLNYAGTAKSFGALLGQGFLLPFKHEEVPAKDGKPAYTRSALDYDNILPGFDQISKAPYPIPAPTPEMLGLFYYKNPKQVSWNRLYIEGTNSTTGKSKNWIQEKILSSVDYIGSPLQMLLEGNTTNMPSLAVPGVPTAAAPVQAPAQAVPQVPAIPAVPVAAPAAAAAIQPAAPIQPWPAQAATFALPTTPNATIPAAPVIPSV